jgi:hypothetical protein
MAASVEWPRLVVRHQTQCPGARRDDAAAADQAQRWFGPDSVHWTDKRPNRWFLYPMAALVEAGATATAEPLDEPQGFAGQVIWFFVLATDTAPATG